MRMKRITIDAHEDNEAAYRKAVAPIDEAIGHWKTSVWVKDLAASLPIRELELHIDRWVEGIDTILASIEYGTVYKNRLGWYGDFTGKNLNAAELRAFAAERWLRGEAAETDVDRDVFRRLGEPTDDKREAVEAYVEIIRAFVARGFDEALSKKWRARRDRNPILRMMFAGEGVDRGINDGGGYWLVNKLDLFLGIIGGADYDKIDVEGSCNVTLRHVFHDDRERMTAAKGYLWGLCAYLNGADVSEIRQGGHGIAGYAIKAYRCFKASKYDQAECRLIAAKLFYTIRYWYIRATIFAVKDEMSPDDDVLPTLPSPVSRNV
jgi:hypothetical protein